MMNILVIDGPAPIKVSTSIRRFCTYTCGVAHIVLLGFGLLTLLVVSVPHRLSTEHIITNIGIVLGTYSFIFQTRGIINEEYIVALYRNVGRWLFIWR